MTDYAPNSEEEYRETVEEAARLAYENGEGPDDDPWELAWHEADNHAWIVAYRHNLPVIEYAEHEPDEFAHMIDDSMSVKEVIQVLAFMAFRGDIATEIAELAEADDAAA